MRNLIDEVLNDERNRAVGRAAYDHRDHPQCHVWKTLRAQVRQHAAAERSEQFHGIIASARAATRAAAPGAPRRPRSELSLATVSLRIESWSHGSAARTRLRAVNSCWMSSGTIFSPARIFGMPIKSTPVISIFPNM